MRRAKCMTVKHEPEPCPTNRCIWNAPRGCVMWVDLHKTLYTATRQQVVLGNKTHPLVLNGVRIARQRSALARNRCIS